MTRKLLIVLTALALASFALVACGDDDDETTPDTGAQTTEETTTEETTAGGGGGGGGTIEPAADPNGDLAYTTGQLSTETGETTIEFENQSSTPHDVQVESPDGETIGGTQVITGDSTTATVSLEEPGQYTYYCSVNGHRQAGMEETLTVE